MSTHQNTPPFQSSAEPEDRLRASVPEPFQTPDRKDLVISFSDMKDPSWVWLLTGPSRSVIAILGRFSGGSESVSSDTNSSSTVSIEAFEGIVPFCRAAQPKKMRKETNRRTGVLTITSADRLLNMIPRSAGFSLDCF